MSTTPRQQLREILATLGLPYAKDPDRLQERLVERCGGLSAEIDLLVQAVREKVPDELVSPTGQADGPRMISLMASRLQQRTGVAPERALWTVQSWALALGMDTGVPQRAAPPDSAPAPRLSSAPIGSAGVSAPSFSQPVAPPSAIPPQAPSGAQPPGVWPPAPTPYGTPLAEENTSGTDGPLPARIAALRWNWGAFFLTWLWCLSNGQRGIGWAYFALGAVSRALSRSLGGGTMATGVTTGVALAQLGVSIYVGFNGHKLAWRNRRFESVDQYFAVQRAWWAWGLGLFIFFVVIGVAALAFFLPFILRLRHP